LITNQQDPYLKFLFVELSILVMGQGQSRRRQNLQEHGQEQQHRSCRKRLIRHIGHGPGPIIHTSSGRRSSIFDFASLLISGEARRTFHHIPPLPNCWDELLDWTIIAATMTTAIIHNHQNENSHHQSHHHHATIRFIPFVDSSMMDQVGKLPSMSWVERATFYTESVSFVDTDIEFRSPVIAFCLKCPLTRMSCVSQGGCGSG
jgi:hypothetical protein